MENKSRLSTILLIVLILLVIIGVWFIVQNKTQYKNQVNNLTTTSTKDKAPQPSGGPTYSPPVNEVAPVSSISTSGWSTYHSSKGGFDINYPAKSILWDDLRNVTGEPLGNFIIFALLADHSEIQVHFSQGGGHALCGLSTNAIIDGYPAKRCIYREMLGYGHVQYKPYYAQYEIVKGGQLFTFTAETAKDPKNNDTLAVFDAAVASISFNLKE